MANPQKENGYTPIAHELLEAIIRTPMSARELKVLLAVARETYGWNCKSKKVTAYHVAQMTGIDRTHASRAMKALVSRNILTRDGDTIGMQKDHDRWEGANHTGVQNIPGAERTRQPGANRPHEGGANRHTYKERGKERKKGADAPASAHHEIMREFDRLFTEKVGARPDISGARDGAIIKALLKQHPTDEILALLRGFFAVGTKFSRQSGSYALPVFKASYNDLLVMKRGGDL